MKREKKFAALIVAMLLCFTLCVAAFAADSDIYTLENGVLTLKAEKFSDGIIGTGTLDGGQVAFTVLVIPEGIEVIDAFAFESCKTIDAIYLPASIKSIRGNAFISCNSIPTIHYAGTEAQKANISIGTVTAIKNAVWIYNSSPSNAVELSFSIADVTVTEGETASMSLVLNTPCTGLAATLKISAADKDGNALALLSAAPGVSMMGIGNDGLDGTLVIATAEAIPAGTAVAAFSFACPEAGEYTVSVEGEMRSGDNVPASFSIDGGSITVKKPDVLIKWLNHDGSIIKSQRVPVGSTPAYSGETPVKAPSDTHTYSFSGWDKAFEAVSTDTEYTAQFTAHVRSYALSISCPTEGVTFSVREGDREISPNADGSYTLAATGSYTVTADAPAYKMESRSVSFSDWTPDTDKGTAAYTFPALEKFAGDVDNDEDIDAADAQNLFNYLAGNLVEREGLFVHPTSAVPFYPAAADLSGDGKIDVADILPLLKLINEQ